MRRTAVLACLMLLAAACSDGGDAGTTTQPTEPPTTSTTTSTTIAETSTTTTLPATTTTEPPAPLSPGSVWCTSELAAYPCSHLVDGDPETRWNAADGGVGATVDFSFDPPIRLAGITLENVAQAEPFLRNARIRTVEITTDDAGSTTFDLADDPNPQRFDLETEATSVLEMTVVAAYPGVEFGGNPPFEELALAEVGFLGYPAPAPDLPEGSAAGRPPAPGISLLAEIEAGGAGEIRDVAFDGTSFLALVWLTDGETTVWASPGGLTWERLGRIGWFDPGDGPSVLIPAAGIGLVAAGRHVSDAAAWHSGDGGASWLEARLDDGRMLDGVLSPVGLVTAGTDGLGGAAAWWSDDGLTWETTSGDEIKAGGPLTRVAASSELLLALGSGNGAAATSLDGRVWRPLDPEGLEAAAITDLVVVDGTALALEPDGPVLWTAARTGAWSAEPLDAMLVAPGKTAAGAGLVLLGNRLVVVGSALPAVPGPDDPPAVPHGWIRDQDGSWTALRPPDHADAPLAPVAWTGGRGRIVVALDDGAGGLVVWVAQPA